MSSFSIIMATYLTTGLFMNTNQENEMEKIVIKIPTLFHHGHFDIILNHQILTAEIKDGAYHVVFDLSETDHISVLGLLLIRQIADYLTERKCRCSVYYGKPKQQSFMAWYSRIMGLVKSKDQQEVQEYLNDVRVEIHRCHNGKESLKAVNKLIPIIKSELKPSDSVLKALNWALWELIDNAGAHGYGVYNSFDVGYSRPVYFCAFNYKEFIDIAILDTGRGIHKSFLLSGKDKYKKISNEEALELAIQDKESGHPHGSPGFGLFGCAEIAKQSKGAVVIISGNRKLVLSGNGKNVVPCGNFNGTMVLLSIPQKLEINLETIFGKDSNVVLESIDDLFGRL